MDTEYARTYLMVVTAGSFYLAAERLHVSQSTVSTRIRSLEDRLGVQLFARKKSGVELTQAGRRFHKHAASLVRTVEAARHELGVPEAYEDSVTVGGRFGLWDGLLTVWLARIQTQLPGLSVRAQVGFEEDLMHGLAEGQIDIALMYTPQSRPGLIVEPLLEERLVRVSSHGREDAAVGDDYVFVDWGADFRAAHSVSFPEFAGAGVTASIGWLALELISRRGGGGYFPLRLVRPHLARRELRLVKGAPEFSLTAYVVYPRERRSEKIEYALEGIRLTAKSVSQASVMD
ncbi:LysR family transcriptional regulator [Ectothiorhodospiraceae bacterium WFHF3C12]|nr:LysR family transcriptional regulator [Ectothiorhodospiraceae bacterium WFHF3C12]